MSPELRWMTFNSPSRAVWSAGASGCTGGHVACPKIYEFPDGNLLLATREGNALAPPQRTTAVTFDVTLNQFRTPLVINEADIACSDTARTADGRLYLSVTFGDPGYPFQGVNLRYSDDGGSSWSESYSIPGMSAAAGCPHLAASSDELYILWREGNDHLLSRAGNSTACDQEVTC